MPVWLLRMLGAVIVLALLAIATACMLVAERLDRVVGDPTAHPTRPLSVPP
jgi:hypothetical protein